MPIRKLVDDSDASAEGKATYDQVNASNRGFLPDLYKLFGERSQPR